MIKNNWRHMRKKNNIRFQPIKTLCYCRLTRWNIVEVQNQNNKKKNPAHIKTKTKIFFKKSTNKEKKDVMWKSCKQK
jgi:predicted nucleotide-binding protein